MTPRTLVLAVLGLCGIGVGYALTGDQPSSSDGHERQESRVPVVFEPPIHDPHQAEFTICSGPVRTNCVFDGDTFWFGGTKIRIADIDAPEISQPICAEEAQAGENAKGRLLDLLNAGRFRLISGRRDQDRYGRKLRIVVRNDVSLGEMLVDEGLAHPWEEQQLGWCDAEASTTGAQR